MTARRAKDYRHFPPEYDDLLRKFVAENGCALAFAAERDARHTARDLYRYREALQLASDAEPENSHVQAMCAIFRDIIVRCFAQFETDEEAARFGDNRPPTQRWHVRLELNPVVAAMRRTHQEADDAAS